jgi:hypothetical protein
MQRKITDNLPPVSQISSWRDKSFHDHHEQLKIARDEAQEQYAALLEKNDHVKQLIQVTPVAWENVHINETSLPCMYSSNGLVCAQLSDFMMKYPQHAQRCMDILRDNNNQNPWSLIARAAYERSMVIFVSQSFHGQLIYLHDLIPLAKDRFYIDQLIIMVEDGVQVSIIDIRNEQKNHQIIIRAVVCMIGMHALVNYFYYQPLQYQANEYITMQFVLAELSQLQMHLLCMNSTTTMDINLILHGARAHGHIRGAYLCSGTSSITLTTQQRHNAQSTESSVNIKGILADQSQALYHGTIMINRQASGTHARQENKNIMLSGHARAYSIPVLEIKNHNVQCMHGSAAGKLDEEQLIYLQSRGVCKKQAQQIIMSGFLADVISVNYPDDLRKDLTESVSFWLSRHNNV